MQREGERWHGAAPRPRARRALVVTPALTSLLVGASACTEGPRAVPELARPAWSEAERERYETLNLTWGEPKGTCVRAPGQRAMIASTSGALGIHAGWRALAAGGSAADAAIATTLAQNVLCAGSWDSLAGMLYAIYYDAATGEVQALNAGFAIPREETDPATIPRHPEPSGRTALVGGFGRGIEALHERHGKLPWATLFDPAIELAENGFVVPNFLGRAIALRQEVLRRDPAARETFFRAAGTPYGEGDVLRQPRLAATLRAMATGGAAHLYTGPWAERFVAAVQEAGGRVTLDDLAAYRARWETPLATDYRGRRVHTLGHPEFGGVQLLEALNLVERTDLPETHWSGAPAALHRLIAIDRLSLAITYSRAYRPHPTDPQPVPWIAPDERIDPAHAARMLERMAEPGWEAALAVELAAAGGLPPPAHSDAIVAVDAEGNVLALVHSINTTLWGFTGLFVDGVSIPDPAAFQQGSMAKSGPGRRLPNIVNPAIVLREGRPVLAAAAIGSALHENMLQALVNILDYGMTPQEEVEAPHFWGPWWGGEAADYATQAIDAGRFAPEVVAAVTALGQPLRELPQDIRSSRISFWAGIRLDPATGELCGATSYDFNGLVHTGDAP